MSSSEFVTPREAAELVGVDKSTILRALKGKSSKSLSGTRDENGNWQIALSELYREFDPAPQVPERSGDVPRPTSPSEAAELAAAQIKIAELTAKLEAAETISALHEQQMRKWEEQATRLALTDESKSKAEALTRASLLEAQKTARLAEERAAKAQRELKEVANQGFFTRLFKKSKTGG